MEIVAADGLHVGLGALHDVDAPGAVLARKKRRILPSVDPAGGLHDAHHGADRHALAAAALPDQAVGLPLVDHEAHAVQRLDHPLEGVEVGEEVSGLDELLATAYLLLMRGSKTSRTASPRRFHPRTNSAITKPGMKTTYQ